MQAVLFEHFPAAQFGWQAIPRVEGNGWLGAVSVAAGLCLGWHKNERGSRLAGAMPEGVQQAENAGVSERNSEGHRSGNGEGDYKRD